MKDHYLMNVQIKQALVDMFVEVVIVYLKSNFKILSIVEIKEGNISQLVPDNLEIENHLNMEKSNLIIFIIL